MQIILAQKRSQGLESKEHLATLIMAWAICAQCVSFLLSTLVCWALYLISEKHLLQISVRIENLLQGPCLGRDDGESGSEWSVVSTEEADSLRPRLSNVQTSSRRQQTYSQNCLREHTTRRGTNAFQTQVRCLQCGLILVKKPLPATTKSARRKTGSSGSK